MSEVTCNIFCCLSSRKIKLSAEAKFMRVSCLRSCQKGQMPLTFGLWFLSRVSVVSCQKVIGNWSGPFSCFPYTTTSYVLYRRMLFVRFCPVFCEASSFGLQQQLSVQLSESHKSDPLSCILSYQISLEVKLQKKLSFWLSLLRSFILWLAAGA